MMRACAASVAVMILIMHRPTKTVLFPASTRLAAATRSMAGGAPGAMERPRSAGGYAWRTASDTLGGNCGARRCKVACSYE